MTLATHSQPMAALAISATQVAGMRMVMLPWWCLMDPARAQQEGLRMITEKHDAMTETHWALASLPVTMTHRALRQPWCAGPLKGASDLADLAVRTLLHPTQRRVSSNHRRLSTREKQ